MQAVKDPMKSKGARLTTEISLPGRFVVYVPQGDGIGVSRRLEDDERTAEGHPPRQSSCRRAASSCAPPPKARLRRTSSATSASSRALEGDPGEREEDAGSEPRLQRGGAAAARRARPVHRGLRARLVDDDRTLRRITGYLKKTSPHMAERVVRHKDKAPLFEAHGVDAEIRSTLHKRVDLPSGSLIFDYAEAFTDYRRQHRRFVGSRSRTSTARLEETVTKNNVEAAKEVVGQLRLRDIGGIIVIDFVDMANPKNRATRSRRR